MGIHPPAFASRDYLNPLGGEIEGRKRQNEPEPSGHRPSESPTSGYSSRWIGHLKILLNIETQTVFVERL
jgi:hypothetical protein